MTVILCMTCLLILGCVTKDQNIGQENRPMSGNIAEEGFSPRDWKVTIYYFHGEFRCPACLKIEDLITRMVPEIFPDELSSGGLELRIVNRDLPENKQFTRLFNIEGQSLIVAVYHKGELNNWRPLSGIMEMYEDEGNFFDYLRDEILVTLGDIQHEQGGASVNMSTSKQRRARK